MSCRIDLLTVSVSIHWICLARERITTDGMLFVKLYMVQLNDDPARCLSSLRFRERLGPETQETPTILQAQVPLTSDLTFTWNSIFINTGYKWQKARAGTY